MLKPTDLQNPDNFDLLDWTPLLSESQLKKMGEDVVEACDADRRSMAAWIAANEEWLRLACQVLEVKNFPWPKAASIKYPLLTTAALQFHARAHQELLKDETLVKAKVIGRDPDGQKAKRAERVGEAMSYQLLFEMEDWQDDMDRLLMILPVLGTVFRKCYWDPVNNVPKSELILPGELVVNYYAKDWGTCRKSHSYPMSRNEMLEMQNFGYYRDVEIDFADPDVEGDEKTDTDMEVELDAGDDPRTEDVVDGDRPFTIIEQHYTWDLDGDGYEEPYTVYVLRETEEVLRVVPRFRMQDVDWSDVERKVKKIDPIPYVNVYRFLPSFDSSIFGSGFGQLIGPLNKATNSIINQLLNAGTLATLQSGFLGQGIRTAKGGSIRLGPNEWKSLKVPGDDIRKGVYHIPANEPSTVMFQLLGFIVNSAKEVGSVTEVMTGQNPGQNQPLGTTHTVLEQGLQVFIGIYKRVYRALAKEYKCMYMLNHMYLSLDHYSIILDDPEANVEKDFDLDGLDILPQADPAIERKLRRAQRVQQLIEAKRAGMPINTQYLTRLFLESMDEPNIEEAMQQEPSGPSEADLKKMEIEGKLELERDRLEWEKQRDAMKTFQSYALAIKALADAKAAGQDPGEAEQTKLLATQFKAIADMVSTKQKTESAIQQDQSKAQLEGVKAQAATQKAQASAMAAQYGPNNSDTGGTSGGS